MSAPDFPTHGIVLAAGLGTRMRPITDRMPKPLVPVVGTPLVDYALDFMGNAGIQQVVVNASYKAEMLVAHLQTRTAPHIIISQEPVPLETGGGIREALPHLGSLPFLSINSDIICINGPVHAVHRLRAGWDEARMDALLLLHPVEQAVGYDGAGDFYLNENGSLRRRVEGARAPFVFAGVQLIHPRLFKGCPGEGPFSMNLLYNRGKTENGLLPRIFGLVHDGDWLHVGDPPGLALAEDYFRKKIHP